MRCYGFICTAILAVCFLKYGNASPVGHSLAGRGISDIWESAARIWRGANVSSSTTESPKVQRRSGFLGLPWDSKRISKRSTLAREARVLQELRSNSVHTLARRSLDKLPLFRNLLTHNTAVQTGFPAPGSLLNPWGFPAQTSLVFIRPIETIPVAAVSPVAVKSTTVVPVPKLGAAGGVSTVAPVSSSASTAISSVVTAGSEATSGSESVSEQAPVSLPVVSSTSAVPVNEASSVPSASSVSVTPVISNRGLTSDPATVGLPVQPTESEPVTRQAPVSEASSPVTSEEPLVAVGPQKPAASAVEEPVIVTEVAPELPGAV